MKERSISGLLTIYFNCENSGKIAIICKNCILNNNFYGYQFIKICEVIERFELTNQMLLKKGI